MNVYAVRKVSDQCLKNYMKSHAGLMHRCSLSRSKSRGWNNIGKNLLLYLSLWPCALQCWGEWRSQHEWTPLPRHRPPQSLTGQRESDVLVPLDLETTPTADQTPTQTTDPNSPPPAWQVTGQFHFNLMRWTLKWIRRQLFGYYTKYCKGETFFIWNTALQNRKTSNKASWSAYSFYVVWKWAIRQGSYEWACVLI